MRCKFRQSAAENGFAKLVAAPATPPGSLGLADTAISVGYAPKSPRSLRLAMGRRLDLQTLRSQLVMLQNLPDHSGLRWADSSRSLAVS